MKLPFYVRLILSGIMLFACSLIFNHVNPWLAIIAVIVIAIAVYHLLVKNPEI